MHKGIDSIGIGAVRGNVHNKYLPCAGGVERIVNKPIKCRLILTRSGIVDNRYIDITILNRIIATVTTHGQIVYGFAYVSVVVTIVFMVTKNMDKVNATHCFGIENGGKRIPIDVLCAVINGIARLNGEIVINAVCTERIKYALYILGVCGLSVADNEEVGL